MPTNINITKINGLSVRPFPSTIVGGLIRGSTNAVNVTGDPNSYVILITPENFRGTSGFNTKLYKIRFHVISCIIMGIDINNVFYSAIPISNNLYEVYIPKLSLTETNYSSVNGFYLLFKPTSTNQSYEPIKTIEFHLYDSIPLTDYTI